MIEKLINADSIQAIDSLIAKIADSLNIGVDVIKENGMHYILEYGKYEHWENVTIASIILGIIATIIAFILFAIILDEVNIEERKGKIIILFAIFLPYFIAFLLILLGSLPYIMSPEIYSIKKVIELIN